MCGIAGYYVASGPAPQPATLQRMADTLVHRGPDGAGMFFDTQVGLAHRRLAIIDLSERGSQPMANEDGTCHLIHNGEIYNYRELRPKLENAGHRFSSQTDSEVILHLYETYGRQAVQHLVGMFAFALWDARERRLLLARDALGIKPLYYAWAGSTLFFASEIKALLAAGVRVEPDEQAMAEYLACGHALGDRTFFAGVHRLLPGCWLECADGKVSGGRWWDLPQTVADRTLEEAAVEIRQLLEQSTRLQIRSDVPLGCHLSGGMDSSAVTVLAARWRNGSSLETFSGAFEAEGCDERPYARVVADAVHAASHEIVPQSDDLLRVLPRLTWHMDEPVAGAGSFPQWMVSILASQRVKVVLGGQGGDELFGGYPRYREALARQAEPKRLLGRRESLDQWYYRVYYGSVLQRTLPGFARRWRNRLAKVDVESAFHEAFARPGLDICQRALAFDVSHYLQGLLHVEDRTSMAASLESRVPLLDHRIVEAALRIPPAVNLSGLHVKPVLRRAVSDILPPQILARSDKKGFPVPIVPWFTGPLRQPLAHVLTGARAQETGLWDSGGMSRWLDDVAEHGQRLWKAAAITLWWRIFVDGETVDAVARDVGRE